MNSFVGQWREREGGEEREEGERGRESGGRERESITEASEKEQNILVPAAVIVCFFPSVF